MMMVKFTAARTIVSDGHFIALQTCRTCGATVMYDPRDLVKPSPIAIHVQWHADQPTRLPYRGEVA